MKNLLNSQQLVFFLCTSIDHVVLQWEITFEIRIPSNSYLFKTVFFIFQQYEFTCVNSSLTTPFIVTFLSVHVCWIAFCQGFAPRKTNLRRDVLINVFSTHSLPKSTRLIIGREVGTVFTETEKHHRPPELAMGNIFETCSRRDFRNRWFWTVNGKTSKTILFYLSLVSTYMFTAVSRDGFKIMNNRSFINKSQFSPF